MESNELGTAASSFLNEPLVYLLLSMVFKSLKNDRPYLTPYLITKGFSSEQINNQIYPIWTYSRFFFTMFFSLISNEFGSWVSLFIERVIDIISYGPLIWSQKLWMIQVTQTLRGLTSSFNFNYYEIVRQSFTLKVKQEDVLGRLIFIWLIGCIVASLIAQGTLYMGWVTYQSLFIGSFMIAILSTILILPLTRISSTGLTAREKPFKSDNKEFLKSLLLTSLMRKIKVCCEGMEVLLLTLMWSIINGLLMIGETYGTSYWYEASIANGSICGMNGIMDAVGKMSSILAHIITVSLPDNMYKGGFISLLGIFVVLNSSACFFLTKSMNYIPAACIFWTVYITTGCLITKFIACRLKILIPEKQHSLMISSQLFSLCFQTLFQLIVSGTGLNLSLSLRYFSLAMASGISLISLPFLYFCKK